MATLMPEGKQSFTDNAGNPLVGGKVWTYNSGTSTPRPTYQDAAGLVPNTNPVILDARGEATIFWDGVYTVVLMTASDVPLWTVNGAASSNVFSEQLDAELRAEIAGTGGGELVGLADGSTVQQFHSEYLIWVKQRRQVVSGGTGLQAALNSGARIVTLKDANYNTNAAITIPEGVTLEGDGKANTAITCTANVTPIVMQNVNDAGLEGVLIVAHSTQTTPLIALNATTSTIARCRVRDVQGSGSATDFPFISLACTGADLGNWAHEFSDISVSGCGTIIRAQTSATNSWINSLNVNHVYANDFIRGMHLIATAGDGCSDSTFLDWAAQTSARTQFGALIADVAVQGTNRKNSFHDVRFYDLINGDGLGYYIGDNVLDTNISGMVVDSMAGNRILDKGINTLVNGLSVPDYIMRGGARASIVTNAGLTEQVVNTASTQVLPGYMLLRTGATSGSLARRFSADPIVGLNPGNIFSTDFGGRPFRFSFTVSRITSAANAIARAQYKNTQADGALAAAGVGIQINNFALFGESFGSALSSNNLGVTMVDGSTYKVMIVVYPGERVEWWVDGVLRATQTTTSAIPAANVACYLHTAIGNVTTAADAQMIVSSISVAAG